VQQSNQLTQGWKGEHQQTRPSTSSAPATHIFNDTNRYIATVPVKHQKYEGREAQQYGAHQMPMRERKAGLKSSPYIQRIYEQPNGRGDQEIGYACHIMAQHE
jgi:hypothetical protein